MVAQNGVVRSSRLVHVALSVIAIGVTAAASSAPRSPSSEGVRITVRESFASPAASRSGTTTTTTSYLLADRSRVEWRTQAVTGAFFGPRNANITRCDLREWISLNLDDREYWLSSMNTSTPVTRPQTIVAPPQAPNLLIETTTRDTGERKGMFGYEARHVVTTERHVPLDATVTESSETVTDGWYIDLDTALSCMRRRGEASGQVIGASYVLKDAHSVLPVITTKYIGTPETGYPVATTVSVTADRTLPDGTRGYTSWAWQHDVREIRRMTLDAGLFEVPTGFRDVSPGTIWHYWKNARQWLHDTIARYFG